MVTPLLSSSVHKEVKDKNEKQLDIILLIGIKQASSSSDIVVLFIKTIILFLVVYFSTSLERNNTESPKLIFINSSWMWNHLRYLNMKRQ